MLSAVDWLTLETRENRGLIFSRGCALSLVDWLTIEIQENKSLNFSKGCALFLVYFGNSRKSRVNFFKGVCAFNG